MYMSPVVAARRNGARRRVAGALLALIALVLGVLTGGGSQAGASTSTTDVVFVHGYGACSDVRAAGMGVLLAQYYWQHAPLTSLHAVEYYGCDTDGESIVEYGPNAAGYYPSPDNNAHKTDARHFSYELAWWLWDNFTSKGKPVDLVGHSMGGLIVTYALQRVAAHDPMFPKYLTVPSVVTISSPFNGAPGFTCPATDVECNEMLPGSQFTGQLEAAGAVQPGSGTTTRWSLFGGVGCDLVSATSTLSLPRANMTYDYSYPCYTHTSYITDYSLTANASVKINGLAYTGKGHALWMISASLL